MSERSQSGNRSSHTSSARRRRSVAAAVTGIEGLEARRLMALVEAKPAENFVDSIGINTHFTFPGETNPYTQPVAINLVKSLGVRHIRSGDHTSQAHDRLSTLYNDAGVRTLIVPDPNTLSTSPTEVADRLLQNYAEAVEGLNEPANWLHTWNGYTSVDTYNHDNNITTPERTLGDFTAVRQFNDELYAQAKLKAPAKQVLSSAMGNPQMNPYLAGTQFDVQAMHPYPGTGAMADYWKFDNFVRPAATLTGGTKPLWVTESGYYNTNAVSGSVTEAAAGKFVPRMLAEFFSKGVERTYLYELIDQGNYNNGAYEGDANYKKERSFGLARIDGAPKPAFNAVKNLISIVNEYPNWNAATQSFGINSTNLPGSLDFTLAHDPADTTGPADVSDVRTLLLKKSTGEYNLLLWREAGKNDTSGSRKVSLTLNNSVSSATLFTNLTGTSPTQTNWSNRSTFNFDVSDSVIVLKLDKPQDSATPQSLGVTDTFDGQTAGQSPSGWTSASGDTSWKIATTGSGSTLKTFAQSTAASGDHYLSKTIAANGSSFAVDFDYAWQLGGTASYGDYAQTVGVDVMDVAGDGYRVVLHQGNSGNSTNTSKTVEIYRLDDGSQVAQLATGTGFNQGGWDTLGYASPNFQRMRIAYDNGTFVVYGDTNFNGTMDVLATAKDTTFTDFTRLKFRSLGSTASSKPAFDNIETNVAMVSVSAPDAAAGESALDKGTFRFTRAGGNLLTPLTVNYTVYGSATNGADYATLAQSVVIPAGQSFIDVDVTASNNEGKEGDENVVVRLAEWPAYHIRNSGRTAEVLIKDYIADLVVTGIKLSNDRPVVDENMTFQITVKNIGTAPVPQFTGWKAGLLFDVQGQNSFLTAAQNDSLGVGEDVTLNVTGSYTYAARLGNHQLTAWVDPALPNWDSTTGVVDESSDRNNAYVSMFRVATTRFTDTITSLSDWSTVDAGWTVKTTGNQTYLENTANTSGTRKLQRTLPTSTDHSWSLDFAHNWQWGGTSGHGQRSLSISADVLDNSGNGFRVRFYQGNGNNSAYDNELVKIYKVQGTTETQLETGAGFDSPGWRSLNANGVPTWRRSRLMYDVGTRTLTVLIDVAGNGTYEPVASAADLQAPRVFTKLGFNAENLINAVAPELDDIVFDTLY